MTRDDRLIGVEGFIAGARGIVNLEGPVGRGQSSRERLFNAPEALHRLTDRGVVVASVANNHSLDAGPEGVLATREALAAVGIQAAGRVMEAENTALSAAVATIRAGDMTAAVVAHDLSPAYGSTALPDHHARAIEDAIAAGRAVAPVVIITLHVRGPPSYLPGAVLERAVDVALAAGATIVAAHGTHALARLERRGRGLAIFGLGNLIFDCDCTSERDGVLVRARVTRDGVGEVRVLPIDAGLGGDGARPAREPEPTLDLLRSLGTRLVRRADGVGYL